jgi:hypothetical protein
MNTSSARVIFDPFVRIKPRDSRPYWHAAIVFAKS